MHNTDCIDNYLDYLVDDEENIKKLDDPEIYFSCFDEENCTNKIETIRDIEIPSIIILDKDPNFTVIDPPIFIEPIKVNSEIDKQRLVLPIFILGSILFNMWH